MSNDAIFTMSDPEGCFKVPVPPFLSRQSSHMRRSSAVTIYHCHTTANAPNSTQHRANESSVKSQTIERLVPSISTHPVVAMSSRSLTATFRSGSLFNLLSTFISIVIVSPLTVNPRRWSSSIETLLRSSAVLTRITVRRVRREAAVPPTHSSPSSMDFLFVDCRTDDILCRCSLACAL